MIIGTLCAAWRSPSLRIMRLSASAVMACVGPMQRPAQLGDTCTSIHQSLVHSYTTDVLFKPHKNVSKPRWLNGIGRAIGLSSHTATLLDTALFFDRLNKLPVRHNCVRTSRFVPAARSWGCGAAVWRPAKPEMGLDTGFRSAPEGPGLFLCPSSRPRWPSRFWCVGRRHRANFASSLPPTRLSLGRMRRIPGIERAVQDRHWV